MWNRPRFIDRRLDALIHESASQEIQGGLPGEHYHISAAAYDALIKLINNPLYSEVVSVRDGSILRSNSGDVVHQLMRASSLPVGSSTSGGSSSPVIISDVVTPPTTPPTLLAPAGIKDPLWNHVTCMTNMGMPVNGETPVWGNIPTADQYKSTIAVTATITNGPGRYVRVSPTRTLYGNTVLEQSAPGATNTPPYLNCSPMQHGGPASFYGDWTVEAGIGQQMRPNQDDPWLRPYMVWPMLWVGNLGYGVGFDPHGTFDGTRPPPDYHRASMRFFVSKAAGYPHIVGGSGLPDDPWQYDHYHTDIPYPDFPQYYTNWHHYVIEKEGNQIRFGIDGVWLRSVVWDKPILGTTVAITGELYGPLRITSGVARYKNALIVPDKLFPQS